MKELLLGLAVIVFTLEIIREILNKIKNKSKYMIPKWVGILLILLYFTTSLGYIVVSALNQDDTKRFEGIPQYIIIQQQGRIDQKVMIAETTFVRPLNPDRQKQLIGINDATHARAGNDAAND